MVRFHNISGFSFDRWLLQNKGVVLDMVDGRYIDSVLVRTDRGVAAYKMGVRVSLWAAGIFSGMLFPRLIHSFMRRGFCAKTLTI